MVRTLPGGILGGVALFFVGFIFWGTPLSGIAYTSVGHERSAAVQQSLADNLRTSGTGTYLIPNPGSAEGDILYARGPVAMVHFNISGYPIVDGGSLGAGFALAIVTGLLMACALASIAARVTDFPSRMRLIVLFALAISLYIEIGQPIFNHFGFGYWIYLWFSDFIGLTVAGFVIAKWFLPSRSG